VIAAVAALTVSGCSLALNGPDPNLPIGQYPSCDRNKTLVGLDALDGAFVGVGAVAAGTSSGTAAAVLGSISALFLLSAYHGNNVVNDCRNQIALTLAQFAPPPKPPD